MHNDILNKLRTKLNEIKELNSFVFAYNEYLNKIRDIVSELDESSSGSWIGFHANLYYEGFKKPPTWQHNFDSEWGAINGIPPYWKEKSYKDIEKYVLYREPNLDLSKVESDVSALVKEAKTINNEITADMVIIQDNKNLESEWNIVTQLAEHEWGASQQEIISYRAPKQIMSRDSFAMMQGIKTPPHIAYDAMLVSLISKITSVEEFTSKALKLLRQVELKSYNLLTDNSNLADAISNVTTLFRRFHYISRQLRSRHADRETIKIKDEYDVQDLLQALLRIYFDDIRREEWNPSYAGGSTRSDFLLKKEQIVLEIKKTRSSMSDKELGEQLIIDVAKYRQHPDCKMLICFVYDPEGIIGNPKGIEDDLNLLSTEQMKVLTIIEPK
ncbi:hypothetical protein [Paenibacillus sp. LC231]|uniref:PD-(D/E)XK nuclease domain-containing protein n=1 Tax=Paenibacillus sp. LC231 TaxID=1120679 RepID=UPI000A5ABA3F|nr:hypothetical protein [Paenibacillus sp. LC231]